MEIPPWFSVSIFPSNYMILQMKITQRVTPIFILFLFFVCLGTTAAFHLLQFDINRIFSGAWVCFPNFSENTHTPGHMGETLVNLFSFRLAHKWNALEGWSLTAYFLELLPSAGTFRYLYALWRNKQLGIFWKEKKTNQAQPQNLIILVFELKSTCLTWATRIQGC